MDNQQPTPKSFATGQATNNRERKGKFSAWWEKVTGKPMSRGQKIILGIVIVIFLFVFYVTLDANKYRAMVHIVEGQGKVGVNPTAESLDFGDLSRGTSAVRRVNIENGTAIPVFIAVWKTGGMGELMKINKNYFKLSPKTSAKIEFTTYVPASAEIDKIYKGRVYLFKIPTFF